MPKTRSKKGGVSSIQEKYDAQRALFASNVTRSMEWRENQLRQCLKFLDNEYDAIAKALTKDLGKCAFEGEITEIEVVRQECEEALKEVRARRRAGRRAGAKRQQHTATTITNQPSTRRFAPHSFALPPFSSVTGPQPPPSPPPVS